MDSFVHLSIHPFIHYGFICPFIHPSIHHYGFIYPFIYPSIHPLWIHLSIYLSIHPFRVLISAVSTKVNPPALHFFNNCFHNKFTNGTNIIHPFIKIYIHCSVPYIHLTKYASIVLYHISI